MVHIGQTTSHITCSLASEPSNKKNKLCCKSIQVWCYSSQNAAKFKRNIN